MKWKSFAVGTAALLALPFAAQAAGDGRQGAWFAGAVVSAGSGSVSVSVLWTGPHATQLEGRTVSVAVDSRTRIVYGKGQTSIDPGDLVGVRAAGSSTTSLTARRIHVSCNCHWIGGAIGGIGVHSLTVQVARTGPYDRVLKGRLVTLQLDASTQYVEGKDRRQIALGDLSVGGKVGVVFAASGFFRDPGFDWRNATFTARRVHLWRGVSAGLNP